MTKILTCILFLLMVTEGFSQTTLYPNVNPNAKELIHHLNPTKDSLVLNSEFTIFKVELYNSGFNKVIDINNREAKIPLYDLPVGRCTVGVFVNRKIITFNIIKDRPYDKVPIKKVDTIRERDSSVYDTIRVKNRLNIHKVVVYEDEVNIVYDTIRHKSITERNITIKHVPYDLSTLGNDWTIIKQSREDYRDKNLRPNGKSYNDNTSNDF